MMLIMHVSITGQILYFNFIGLRFQTKFILMKKDLKMFSIFYNNRNYSRQFINKFVIEVS